MSWFQLWTVCWQVTIVALPILLGSIVLWLNSRFVSKSDLTAERNRVDAGFALRDQAAKTESVRVDAALNAQKSERDARWEAVRDLLASHDGRLKLVEVDVAKPPSRHVLNNAISKMEGGIHSLGKSLDQLRQQMDSQAAESRRAIETQSQYLHALIEKHIR